MIHDLQKASIWKRIAAWLFDGILVGVVAVGLAFLLSGLLQYDSYLQTVDSGYEKYANQYQVNFDLTSEGYEALSEAEKQRYDEAYKALTEDEEIIYAYNMAINLTLVITTGSLLISILLLEFMVPAIFGNGQTFGKKMMGLGVMRTDSVQLTRLQLLVRTLLGKFSVETMIPVYLAILILLGAAGSISLLILTGLLIAQIVTPMVTKNHSQLHDLMAGTIVVDINSQMIFRSTDDLIAYRKKLAAEEAAKKSY